MKPEQAALLRKASESLRAARLLADAGFYDFAASRAYYSMLYVAEAFLLGEGIAFPKHTGVIGAFGQHFAKTGRVSAEYHRHLLDAQISRQTGDYDIGPGMSQSDVSNLLARADEFLKLAQEKIGTAGTTGREGH